jgi:tetratricopeptide (TPR) repeat protein
MRRTQDAAPSAALLLVVALLGAGCSTHRPSEIATPGPAQVPSTSDIDALLDRGCFTCLEQALAAAEERRLPQPAFEAAALLVLRTTELGMPSDAWMTRARALAADDPSRTLYLEMLAAIPPDPLRGMREDLLVETQARSRARSLLPSWREALRTGALSSRFRQYLDLALTCTVDTSPERDQNIARLVAELPDLPLLQYRAGICLSLYAPQLTALRARDVDFVDADYVMGRHALGGAAPDPEEAMRRFRAAVAAFPTSTAIPVAVGNLYQAWEEWTDALSAYDSALALLPTHPDALLGRAISLSHLNRHQEAIDAATRLIDGGRWFLGQAHYWRAWNHYNLGDNAAARLDADRTRTLMVNSSVFVLSGLIEWRVRHLDTAEHEFQEALTMDFGQCQAALYLGAVRSERAKRSEAIAAFNQARQCYDLSIAVHRKAIANLVAGPGTPQSKAREVARHERAIVDAESRRGEAVKAIEQVRSVK